MRTTLLTGKLLLAWALVGSVANAQEKITLKLNLPKGTAYRMTSGMDLTTGIKVGDQKIEIPMTIGMDIDFDVEDVDSAGTQTFNSKYSGVRMKMGGPIAMEYDSSKPGDATNPLGKVMGALVGSTIKVKLGSDGKVKGVEGAEELVKKMAESMKGTPGADKLGKQQVDQMKAQFDQMSAWLPKQPVGVGDTWDVKMDLAGDPNTPMTIDGKCKLVERKAGIAQIEMDGKVSSNAGLNGTVKGKIGINEKTGWAMTTDMDMKMGGKVMGQELEIAGKVTQSTTNKK